MKKKLLGVIFLENKLSHISWHKNPRLRSIFDFMTELKIKKNQIQFGEDREVTRSQTKNWILVLFSSFHSSQKYFRKTSMPTRDVISLNKIENIFFSPPVGLES